MERYVRCYKKYKPMAIPLCICSHMSTPVKGALFLSLANDSHSSNIEVREHCGNGISPQATYTYS